MARSTIAMDVRRWVLYAVALVGAAVAWLVLAASSAQAGESLIQPERHAGSRTPTAAQSVAVVEKPASPTVGPAAPGATQPVRSASDPAQPPTASKPAVPAKRVDAPTHGGTVGGMVDTARETAAETESVVGTVVTAVPDPVVEPIIGGVREALNGKRPDPVAGESARPERPSGIIRGSSGMADARATRDASTVNRPVADRSLPGAGAGAVSQLGPVGPVTTVLAEIAGGAAPEVAVVDQVARDALADLRGGLELSAASVTGSLGAPTFIAVLGELATGLGLMLVGLALARDRRTPAGPVPAPGSTPD